MKNIDKVKMTVSIKALEDYLLSLETSNEQKTSQEIHNIFINIIKLVGKANMSVALIQLAKQEYFFNTNTQEMVAIEDFLESLKD